MTLSFLGVADGQGAGAVGRIYLTREAIYGQVVHSSSKLGGEEEPMPGGPTGENAGGRHAPVPLSPDEEGFLRSLARLLVTVPRALEADLVREQGMGASEYFTLMHLSEAPGRRLRMSDLAARTALTLSGITRIVTRLEGQGFVVRENCAADHRAFDAVLTGEGLLRLERAWPAHLASVRRRLFDPIGDADLRAFTAAMRRVVGDPCGQLPESEHDGAGT
jgi:DNA-binding MarR family transcriptional regulator